MQDNINSPKHYNQGNIECIDFIEEVNLDKSSVMAGSLANVIKYLWRYEDKENPVEDIKKALWYMDRAIFAYHRGYDKTNDLHKDFSKLADANILVQKTKNELEASLIILIFTNLFYYEYDKEFDNLLQSNHLIIKLLDKVKARYEQS